MNDDHTFAPEMTAEEAIQMVLKRPEMYGLQKVSAVPDVATEGDYHEGLEEGIKIGRAERDAALAAVEATRKMHHKITRYVNDYYSISAESYEDDPSSHDELEPFDLCAECYEVERLICEICGDAFSIGHRSSWPCPTIAALDGAPKPEWEYQCTNNINTTELLADPELHAKQCAGRIERRRKAGPWEPVGGETDGA